MRSSTAARLLVLPGCILLLVLAHQARALAGKSVFTDEEVKQCGDIRIPEMTVTPSGVLLLAQCRQANISSSRAGRRLDDQSQAKVVTKFSHDMGKTWGPMVVLTKERGHSHGQAIYDRIRKRVLLQYQYHPSVDPEFNSTLYQSVSTDDGKTWSKAKIITHLIKTCNPKAPQNMQVGSAGAKIQTSSGRIIFVGHASHDTGCRWYTDDGGDTFHASSPYASNEAAVAEVAPGWITMQGRGAQGPWHNNRTFWTSHDDGATFSGPYPSRLLKPTDSGCSAGLVADPYPGANGQPSRLFLAEPRGPGRVGLTVHCSLDGGVTWPHKQLIGKGDDKAAYSSLRMVKGDHGKYELLVVWEVKPGMRSTRIDTSFCS